MKDNLIQVSLWVRQGPSQTRHSATQQTLGGTTHGCSRGRHTASSWRVQPSACLLHRPTAGARAKGRARVWRPCLCGSTRRSDISRFSGFSFLLTVPNSSPLFLLPQPLNTQRGREREREKGREKDPFRLFRQVNRTGGEQGGGGRLDRTLLVL